MPSKAQILVTIWVGKNLGAHFRVHSLNVEAVSSLTKGLPGSQVRFCWVRLYVQQKLIEHEMF